MNLTRLLALLILSFFISAARAQTAPAVETGTIAELFVVPNPRFNQLDTLQKLTSDALAECGYTAAATISYRYTRDVPAADQEVDGDTWSTHRVELVLADQGETETLLSVSGEYRVMAGRREQAGARADLFQDVKDRYFLQLKKFKKCQKP